MTSQQICQKRYYLPELDVWKGHMPLESED